MNIVCMFDKNYYDEGVRCLKSAEKYGAKSYALCLDQETKDKIGPEALLLSEIEKMFPVLSEIKNSRPWNAYVLTLRPFLPEFIFRYCGEKQIICVDSDMVFYSDLEEIDQEMGDDSFMVAHTEMESIPFNDGFIVAKDDLNTKNILSWWQTKVMEWCLWEWKGNLFCAEGYLRILKEEPNKFFGVKLTKHPGINLGPWNMRKHNIIEKDGIITVDGKKLICFHHRNNISWKKDIKVRGNS